METTARCKHYTSSGLGGQKLVYTHNRTEVQITYTSLKMVKPDLR